MSKEKTALTPEQQLEFDVIAMKEKIASKSKGNEYAVAVKEISRLRAEIDEYSTLRGVPDTYTIMPKRRNGGESVAFAIASDWHVEENVVPETVDGTNEYTMRIAKKRADNFFRNTLTLVQTEQQRTKVDTLVVALLGDFFSGNIHEELLESCEVRPADAMLFAQSLIASGIKYLLDNSKLNIVIPCAVGNHSRTTHQVHVSQEHGLSLEWIMYNNLAQLFEKNKRVTFVMSRSYFTWLDVFGYQVRFHHGHAIKYGGGIGGLTIPLIKAISRYDLQKRADLDVCGHFHNRIDGGKFIVNGSLIGNTPYGYRLGFTGKPEQAFFMVQKGYGKTVVAPIFVE